MMIKIPNLTDVGYNKIEVMYGLMNTFFLPLGAGSITPFTPQPHYSLTGFLCDFGVGTYGLISPYESSETVRRSPT